MDSLRYRLAQPICWHALDAGVPGVTSAWNFDHVHERLLRIRDANTEVFPPNQYATPAAHIQAFTGGVIATRLPDREHWIWAINADPELKTIWDIMTNPSRLCNKALADINYNYHSALRKSLIVLEDGILNFHKPLAGCNSYTRLRLVPTELCNILFVAFHATRLAAISTRIVPSIASAYVITGQECGLTSNECAQRAPGVHYLTPREQNPANWCTTFR